MYCDKALIYQGMEKKMMNFITNDSTKKILKIIGHFASIVFITAFLHWVLCLLYTSPSPRDLSTSRMPSSA